MRAVNELQLDMYKHLKAIRIKIYLCRYASGQVECCERRNPLNVAILSVCYVNNDFNSGIVGLQRLQLKERRFCRFLRGNTETSNLYDDHVKEV